MRIGIDVRELEKGKATGIGRYLLNFLKFAIKEKAKWEFVLFGNQTTKIDLEAPNLKKIFIPEYLTFWWDQVQLPYHLKKEKIDLFLTPYFKAPLRKIAKLIIIINDLIPLAAPQYQGMRHFLKKVYFKNLIKRAAKKGNRIITISEHSRKDIVKFLKVKAEKIKVIRLSISENFRPIGSGPNVVLAKYGIKNKFIFYFGNFSPHKNVETLIRAYGRLPQAIKNEYRLVLGGRKDAYCSSLSKLIKCLDLEDNVIFTGFILEEDLPYIYSASQIFVFPSFYEGFGLPVLEAMACGVPVVASSATSLPEVAGDAAILVDPADIRGFRDAIYKALTNDDLRRDLIEKGLKRAKDFSIDKTAGEILEIIEECK